MKKLLGLFVFATLVSGTSFAAEQSKDGIDFENPNHHGAWHCTAYPEGHGHTFGYSAVDEHYNHAYYGAIRRCESATGHHCHHVDCHYDHH